MRLKRLVPYLMSITLVTTPVHAMSDKAKKELYDGVVNYQHTINIPIEGMTQKSLNDYIKSMKLYHVDSMKIGGVVNKRLYIYPTYYENKENMREVNRFASLVASEVEGLEPYEKVYYITQRISEKLKYDNVDNGSTSIFSPYSALSTGKGVCQAYARLADVIFKKAGIKADFVEGITNNMPHLWNSVQIDGEWFSVDITSADLEQGLVDFSYILMNVKDLKDKGLKVTKTNQPLSGSNIKKFSDIGLVSTKEKRFYSPVEEGLLSVGYKSNDKVSVTSIDVDTFFIVGGDTILLDKNNLVSTEGLVYASNVDANTIELREHELYANGRLVHNPIVTPTHKTRVVAGDFKVTLKDDSEKAKYHIENKSNRTNVYYNDEFVLQVIRTK